MLGQLQITSKSNEIPALRDLLDQFNLTNTLVTMEAMHTQTATAEHIVTGGGAYLITIKANQPRLLAWAKSKKWATMPPSWFRSDAPAPLTLAVASRTKPLRSSTYCVL